MATIIQRAVQNTSEDSEFSISEEEKDALLAEMDKLERVSKELKKDK